MRAAAPSVLGGKSGFRRPPSTEGATDCAHSGWGRGGICREVAPKRHFICTEVAPKRHFIFSRFSGNPPPGGRAHGRWVRAAAPSVLGGKSGFRRPPSTEGATDCAHFGWGRGGICREVAPKRHFIYTVVAPKRHLCPRITGVKGVNVRYA